MNLDPNIFPDSEERFLISGPVGPLEIKAEAPAQDSQSRSSVSVIISHPHPLFGGTMENKVVTTIFRAFHHMGARVVRFNYRGVGASKGQYAEAIGETDDLFAVIRWVESVRPDDDIWLVGFSFGAYVAARAASEISVRKKVKQLITVAPPVHHFNFVELTHILSPWLVIQGDADEVVPPDQVFQWVKKLEHSDNPPKLITLHGVGHFFHRRLLDLRDILIAQYQGAVGINNNRP